MGKIITSTVPEWGGEITLASPFTLPQVASFMKLWRDLTELGEVSSMEQNALIWPVLRSFIQIWSIEGLEFPGANSFPGQPLSLVDDFMQWLFKECLAAYNEAEDEALPKA
ncbi:MAG: hypothetical protein JRD89_14560 [Deltaproteobacteria bacterium]|nr:hypothetical protein [Deltaproteobacteria bacterium]